MSEIDIKTEKKEFGTTFIIEKGNKEQRKHLTNKTKYWR